MVPFPFYQARKRVGRWWAARSSKPVWGVRNFPGGFDSHALPPLHVSEYFMMCHNPLEIEGFLLNKVQDNIIMFAEIRGILGVYLGVFDLVLVVPVPINGGVLWH